MTARELKQKAFFGIQRENIGVIVGNYTFDKDELKAFCEQLLLEYDQSQFDDPSLAEEDFYADGRDHFITELFKTDR